MFANKDMCFYSKNDCILVIYANKSANAVSFLFFDTRCIHQSFVHSFLIRWIHRFRVIDWNIKNWAHLLFLNINKKCINTHLQDTFDSFDFSLLIESSGVHRRRIWPSYKLSEINKKNTYFSIIVLQYRWLKDYKRILRMQCLK